MRHPIRRRAAARDTPQDERTQFALAYLEDLDVPRAADRAGLSVDTARRLAASTSFQRELDALRGYRSKNVHIYAENVLRRWWQLATADPRELVELRRVACRCCHGLDHRYQFTPEEHRNAVQKYVAAQQKRGERDWPPFDDQGGVGYRSNADPHPDCPECCGEGIINVHLHDTRTLSPAAALLYQGVEVKPDGSCRVLMRDRSKAMDNVSAHLGMRVERHAHLHAALDPAMMTDEQLEAALEAFGRAAKEEPIAINGEP